MKRLLKIFLGLCHFHGLVRHRPRAGNRILIYHSFGSRLPHDSYGISLPLAAFEKQVRFMKSRWEVIPIDPKTYLSSLDRFSVAISIDDGYADNQAAADLLTSLQVPFLINVVTGFLGRPGYLDPSQVRLLAANPLCTIGSHTQTHARLGFLPREEQERELAGSRKTLEDLTGRPVEVLSYPHGIYSPTTRDLAREAGYKVALSSRNGLNTTTSFAPFALKRTEVIRADTVWSLRRKILGYEDPPLFGGIPEQGSQKAP